MRVAAGPVADEQAEAGWVGLVHEDGGQDGGEHYHLWYGMVSMVWYGNYGNYHRPDHVEGEAQPPRPALQHHAGHRVGVNLDHHYLDHPIIILIILLVVTLSQSSEMNWGWTLKERMVTSPVRVSEKWENTGARLRLSSRCSSREEHLGTQRKVKSHRSQQKRPPG